MTAVRKRRKGFSLIEMVVVAIMLAIVTIACVLVSQTVSAMRIRARNNILLTTHNLNVMEQLRQEMNRIGITGQLEVYYGFEDDKTEYNSIVSAYESEVAEAHALGLTPPDYRDPNDLQYYRPNYSTYTYRTIAGSTVVDGDIRTAFPVGNTGDIRTDVYLDISEWDNFHVYSVRIESQVLGYAQKLTSNYVLTDIGIEKNPVAPW